ncbi:hypothetical protein Poly24_05150 [Rosistilla carotiformis]|uniref:DUF4868 domain-containing protein n=1 Tax=Rosistilla carotiformis TaxID=2528017 RepID=A0A518JMV7_9BACT|nr:hypothetical protein [Rosistilla carotiformis]QDV66827.1 hypothetical protein Poly24_05150 [Rosistilla carotiformis]
MLDFYAVTRQGTLSFDLERIRLERPVQEDLSAQFEAQAAEFVGADCEPLPFSCQHRIERDSKEVFCVDAFQIPKYLRPALDEPAAIGELRAPFTTAAPQVKAIVGVDATNESFFFQYFERRRILDRRRVFIFNGSSFNSIEYPAVMLDEHLVASIVDNRLCFKSFHRTNQFLDLSDLYATATDVEVSEVLSHPKLLADSAAIVDSGIANRTRQQFSRLIHLGILDRDGVTPDRIRNGARKYEGLESIRVRNFNGQRLVEVPTEKRVLAKFLKFLCEELYVGDLTGDQRSTNSSRVEVPSS